MKFSRKNYLHILVLYSIYLLLVIIMCRGTYLYGSTLDWAAQHYAIPDYFRKLFYETGDLFPNLALNIGAGENIYNLSYYGLFSPIILFSYLLPFVKMSTYIQATAIIGVLVSLFIFYKWMLKKFESNTAFLLSLVFLFSTSFVFHSHRHIMFVNYMPFLLLSFMAVEDYFAGKKKYKLIIFPFLMIMTSYFFAVSGMVAVAVYGIYVYLKSVRKFKIKDFAKQAVFFAYRLIIAIFMSGVLILPTMYCLLNGRESGNSHIDWTIFLPSINMKYIMYHNYSMGLSLFAVTAIICAIMAKDKHRRFLGIVIGALITFPVFVYILNGTLYTDAKVLIPFMPLCVILVGQAFNDIIGGNFKYKWVLSITAAYTVIGLIFYDTYEKVFNTVIIELIVILLFLFLYYKKQAVQFVYIAITGVMAVSWVYGNFEDTNLKIERYEKNEGDDIYEVAEIVAEDDELVRTCNLVNPKDTGNTIYNIDFYSANIYSSVHNKIYNNFYFNELYNENQFRNTAMTTQSQSILNMIYMSEKYLIVENDTKVPTGYELIYSNETMSLYENENVLPFGYVSSEVMNFSDYEKFEYPYSLDALFNYSISENLESTQSAKSFESSIEKIEPFELKEDFYITKEDGRYRILSDASICQVVELSHSVQKDEILLVSMTVDNDLEGEKFDAKVDVNGIRNTLSNPSWKYYNGNTEFQFVVTSNNRESFEKIKISLNSGNYAISDIKCWVMKIPDTSKAVDKFKVNKEETKGDVICGTINVTNDGYFNLSVPYSDGFEVLVDGEKVDYEMADNAFIGFEISAGEHDIRITFEAPLSRVGKYMSLAGIVLFVVTIIFDISLKKEKCDN